MNIMMLPMFSILRICIHLFLLGVKASPTVMMVTSTVALIITPEKN